MHMMILVDFPLRAKRVTCLQSLSLLFNLFAHFFMVLSITLWRIEFTQPSLSERLRYMDVQI